MKMFIIIIAAILIVVAAVFAFNYYGNNDTTAGETGDNTSAAESITAQIADELATKYQKPADSFELDITQETDSFAKGNVRIAGENGGGLWFGAKKDGKWELAYDGNGIMSCDIANNYELPKDFVPTCLDTANNNNLVER